MDDQRAGVALGFAKRRPRSETRILYTSNKRRFGFERIVMPKRDRFLGPLRDRKLNIHKHQTRYDASKIPTRIHEEPFL